MNNRAKIVNIEISVGDAGLYHATSPQIQELFVSGETIEEALSAVPSVIEAIFDAHGESVTVVEAEANDPSIPAPWVILSKSSLVHAV